MFAVPTPTSALKPLSHIFLMNTLVKFIKIINKKKEIQNISILNENKTSRTNAHSSLLWRTAT